jgi:hypothetical protein
LTERSRAAPALGRGENDERAQFREVIRDRFHPACERRPADPAAAWPRGLLVREVEGAPGILEMTWSFAGPDGRATFEWLIVAGQPIILWRRIGGHRTFDRP